MSVDSITTCNRIDAEFDRRFEVSAAEISAEARKHLASCARCRNLYSWIAEQPAVTGVSSELSQRIQGQLVAALTPVKPVASIKVCVLRFLAIFLAFAAGLVVTMGAAGLRQMSTGQFLGSGLLLAAGAVLFSLSLAQANDAGQQAGHPDMARNGAVQQRRARRYHAVVSVARAGNIHRSELAMLFARIRYCRTRRRAFVAASSPERSGTFADRVGSERGSYGRAACRNRPAIWLCLPGGAPSPAVALERAGNRGGGRSVARPA